MRLLCFLLGHKWSEHGNRQERRAWRICNRCGVKHIHWGDKITRDGRTGWKTENGSILYEQGR